jgi:phytoene desaturase (3,4-didehydrolycopene-forming)
MRHSIIHEEINTPGTWKEKFNLDKGAILGLSHSFFNVLSFRPNTKHAKYQDLYFVGASTHPGTGVPICLAGSKITAEQILDDRRLGVPWTRNGEQGAKGKGGKVEVKDIDRIQSGPSTLSMLLVALFLTLILYWTMMR